MKCKIHPSLEFANRAGKDYDFPEISGLLEAGWTQQLYEEARGSEEKTFEE